jgi:hypothetical protein
MLVPESGALSFRALACAGLPDDWRERAEAGRLVLPADSAAKGGSAAVAVAGWSGPRYAGDGDFAGCVFGEWILLAYVTAARSVPAGLLARDVAIEEVAEMKALGRGWLKRAERAVIRKNVLARLQGEMPWNFRAIWIAVRADAGNVLAFCSALSDADADRLALAWRNTFGTEIEPMSDQAEALVRKVKLADLRAVRFAPGPNETMFCESVGADFLTWVWCRAEVGLPLAVIGQQAVEAKIEDPLMLVLDGNGCRRTVLTKGNVMGAMETRAALMAGKKLARCKLTLVLEGSEPMGFTVDASLAVRSLKPPPAPDLIAPGERLGRRLQAAAECYGVLRECFGEFLRVRTGELWDLVRDEIQRWIELRKVTG